MTGTQKTQSAVIATLATLAMPLCIVIMGVIFLKEPITFKAIAGGILMIAGFIIISLRINENIHYYSLSSHD